MYLIVFVYNTSKLVLCAKPLLDIQKNSKRRPCTRAIMQLGELKHAPLLV